MSNKIYKYNQAGVASNIQLGKKGGHVVWKPLGNDGRFEFSTGTGQNTIFLTPLSVNDYSSTTNTNITDETLVTAGYVKSLVQGMRTKRSVQTASESNIPVNYFHPVNSSLAWTGSVLSIDVLKQPTIRALFGFGGYVPTNPNSESDPVYAKLRAVFTAGTRILLKNQTHNWQNGIYVFTVNEAKSELYLKRADDMDVEDEVEGAYVFVEQGTLENTGWVGNVPGSPESILDMRAPVLKSITFNLAAGTNNYNTADGTAGYTKITFDQFHGAGTIDGDPIKGTSLVGNKIGLFYDGVATATDDDKLDISRAGLTVIQVENATTHTKKYVSRRLGDMLHEDFRLFPQKIRDNRGTNVAGMEVRVASDHVGTGSAIEFEIPASANTELVDYIARPRLLSASINEFSIDYGGREAAGAIGSAAKGANIRLIAGGTDNAAGAGGDVIIQAGNARTAGTSIAGNIVLSAGFVDNAQSGTVRVEGSALRLPVGDNDGRPEGVELGGAIRLNTALEHNLQTLEYYNGASWVQLDGASYFIHDKPNYGATVPETVFDTFISTMGTSVAGGTVAADHTNTLTFVAHGYQVMSAKEGEVTVTPHGAIKLAPVGNSTDRGDISLTTPVSSGGTYNASSGEVTVVTGSNTTSTTSGSQSGKIVLTTGDHRYRTGDVEISTGSVKGTGTVANPAVGSLYLSTGKPEDTTAAIGTVYIGVSKQATLGTNHVKNNVVIGDASYTQKVKVDGIAIELGNHKDTTSIVVGKKGTSLAESSGDVTVFGKNVTISADDTTNSSALAINGRNINVGAETATTNVTVGHTKAGGVDGSTVDIKGTVVSVVSDNTLTIKSSAVGGNVVFETVVDTTGDPDTYVGGVLTVQNPNYDKACTSLQAIPNVKYVQDIIKDGRFGPGTRSTTVSKATADAGVRGFQIGAKLPSGAQVTRVSLSVDTGFKWSTDGIGITIKAANNLADAIGAGGKILMADTESDIEASPGVTDTRTYVSEFGAGIDAGGSTLFVVFPLGSTPEAATQGVLRVLVEFVAEEPAATVLPS